MKKLLLLFALLCASAFGQVHSDIATQNTQGNWVKAIPEAQVYLCDIATTDLACLVGTGTVQLYTDKTLSTTTTQPVIADSDGNYTLYANPGIYKQCVKGVTTFCQIIEVPSVNTTVIPSVTCPGALPGSLAAWTTPTDLSCDPHSITDFLGNLQSQSYQAVGPHNGEVWLTSDGVVSASAVPANTIGLVVPNVVPTPFRVNFPPAPCTDGQVWQQLSHSTDGTGTYNAFLNCLTVGAGTGSVTSVAQVSPTGVLSQSGGPVTTTGTFTWVWSATSGGLLCFTGASTAASSGLLAANAPLIGGGAGVCPTTGARSGNTTVFGTTSGSLTSGDCAKFDASGNIVDAGAACGSSGGGANKIPFDSCTADQTINGGNAYWRAVTYAASAGVASADIGAWEYAINAAGTVICKLEIPSNASGTMHVFLDVSALDSVAGHTAAFKVCYSVSSSQNINNLSYTCTATQNYTSTSTAYANTRLDFTIASATVGEYLVANIVQSAGGTNTNPARVVAKVKVF